MELVRGIQCREVEKLIFKKSEQRQCPKKLDHAMDTKSHVRTASEFGRDNLYFEVIVTA